MRVLLLASLFLIGGNVYPSHSIQQDRNTADHAIIRRQRTVLVRSPAIAKEFPHRKTAVVIYPVISGLPPVVLRKVRQQFAFKNIFDYSLNEYREDAWLSEFSYVVNHNANHLLDITFNQSGVAAYPDDQSKHFLLNLKTGESVSAVAAFQGDKLSQLAALVDRRLQQEIAKLKKENASANEPDESIDDAYEQLKFEPKDLDNFSVGKRGITFLYDAGFPHVIKALEPNGHYLFTFEQLKSYIKLEGPLGQFVR